MNHRYLDRELSRSSFFLKIELTSAGFKFPGKHPLANYKLMIFFISERFISSATLSKFAGMPFRGGFRTISTKNNLPFMFFCYLLERRLFIIFISSFNLVKTRVNKFLRMSFKVTGGLPWSSFKFKLFVILMKNLFITEVSCFWSEASSLFSLSNILLEFNPLLPKYGLIAFQNFLLSAQSFTFIFWK